MSRLIVKNLPKSVTPEFVREIFSKKGLVTDVQLKYTKDGTFRHFGFVGYKTEEEAQRAIEYFNNSCIKTCKIKVEMCAGLGDPNKPQAWSKYAPDSSAYKKQHKGDNKESGEKKEKSKKEKENKKDIVKDLLEKHKDDPLFVEFMETHAKGNKALWSNDTPLESFTKLSNEKDSSKQKKDTGSDSGHESNASEESENELEENVARKEISDLEYLKMKTIKADEGDNNVQKEEKSENESKTVKTKNDVKQKPSVQFFTVKVKGLAYKAKKKDVKQFFHPLKPKSIRLPPKNKGIAYVGFKSEKEMKQALNKHMTFLAGKRILVTKYVQKDEYTFSKDTSRWSSQEESLKNEETIAESGRIFVRNLAYTTTEEDIEQLFNKFGPVTEVIMPVDRNTRKAKGYAVVTFLVPENAASAFMALDGSVFHGRMLHLLPGKAKLSLEELMEQEGLTYKQKQMLKKKAEAASSHNWNTLFLGQNAVADLIAETYNTTKDQVLDSSGKESIAVRLALGETQIVSQMREFLEESGVHLDAFNQAPKQRSKTIILAKNLPAKTSVSEIRQLFAKHGELGRVVMPPSGVTAIIEFLEPSEAKAAFTRLAYSKFKHLPLYLEWAPSDTFTSPPPTKTSKERKNIEGSEENNERTEIEVTSAEAEKKSDDSSDEEDEPPEPETTLFMKNLNFSTEKEDIMEHFKKCGPIHEVTVAKKKDPKNPGQLLSMGYGFIQFKRKASADKALKTLQQSVLNGHSIELKRSNRTSKTEVATARKITKIGKQTGTKILVRNIPFQATRKEVLDLFKTFGELKALRLPKKMVGTGTHRGFAFVDYYTKHEAKRAFKALCQSTHLYGRRLVLEWATTEENVEDLRKRTAENFSEGPLNKTLKKSTASYDMDENSE
ncbi:probable RNA-binding protein 19 [Periplaneta americana]|uniref:probable RNA-binding protein 19 n=1 Tax=Periplaneta americana TaxID=6978 RepID=UPI0037E71ECD